MNSIKTAFFLLCSVSLFADGLDERLASIYIFAKPAELERVCLLYGISDPSEDLIGSREFVQRNIVSKLMTELKSRSISSSYFNEKMTAKEVIEIINRELRSKGSKLEVIFESDQLATQVLFLRSSGTFELPADRWLDLIGGNLGSFWLMLPLGKMVILDGAPIPAERLSK